MMEEIKRSSFGLSEFSVTDFTIKRKPIEQGEVIVSEINPSGIINREHQSFFLMLNVTVTDSNESYHIELSAYGLFLFDSPISEMSDYFCINAPALIFPYIRSYIAGVTALSGLSAINIPVMHLQGLKDKIRENIIESSDSAGEAFSTQQ